MPNVQKRTDAMETSSSHSSYRKLTSEQFQREADYLRATIILREILAKGMITELEFRKIDNLNRQSFSPQLASIMP